LLECSGEGIGGEFHVTEVLEKLLKDVEHDRGVGCLAVEEELSPSVVGAFAGLQPRNVGQRLRSGVLDAYPQLRHARGSRELRVAVSATLAPKSHVTEPELADFTTVNDERGDRIGRGSERPFIHPVITEPLGDFEHLPESVRYVDTRGVDCQFHAMKVATLVPVRPDLFERYANARCWARDLCRRSSGRTLCVAATIHMRCLKDGVV
jgi:hypothetical protein